MTKNTTRGCARCADAETFRVVGVDVSKRHLDAHELPSGRSRRFNNTKAGIRDLRAWVCPAVRWVAYESTGSHHLGMEDALAAGLPLSRLNPKRARHFAKALGAEAKTDRVDARMLAEMGRMVAGELTRTRPRAEAEKAISELCVARAAHRMVRDEIERDIRSKKKLMKRYDAELERLARTDPEFLRKAELLVTMDGVAMPTAIVLLSEAPELGTLTSREAASLAGLAPVANDSGERRGKRSMRGGRKRVRTAAYMSAMSAVRRDPGTRDAHEARKARGMNKKASLLVAARKAFPTNSTPLHTLRRTPASHARACPTRGSMNQLFAGEARLARTHPTRPRTPQQRTFFQAALSVPESLQSVKLPYANVPRHQGALHLRSAEGEYLTVRERILCPVKYGDASGAREAAEIANSIDRKHVFVDKLSEVLAGIVCGVHNDLRGHTILYGSFACQIDQSYRAPAGRDVHGHTIVIVVGFKDAVRQVVETVPDQRLIERCGEILRHVQHFESSLLASISVASRAEPTLPSPRP